MLFYKRRSVFIGLMLVSIGLLISCKTTPPLATPSAPGISVGIEDDQCPSIEVQVGQQVTWTNQGTGEHIVSDMTVERMSQFDSGVLKPGDDFSFTFSQPGRYNYQCSVDEVLTGTITVEPQS